MLFIATLCFAKLSIVALIHRLTPSRTHRRLNFVIAVLVATATITSEFVAAFQCAVPTTWVLRGDTCIERVRTIILDSLRGLRRTTGRFLVLFRRNTDRERRVFDWIADTYSAPSSTKHEEEDSSFAVLWGSDNVSIEA